MVDHFFPGYHYFTLELSFFLYLSYGDCVFRSCLFSLIHIKSIKPTACSLLHTLIRRSVACSQESPWPTWTPAWQVTRRQPPSTLVRGSTCWTWSPLARRSPRLQTHGNNLNRTMLLIVRVFLSNFLSSNIMVDSNPGGLLSKCKWRNVPFLPLYDCCFSFSYFPCLFWDSPFFVIAQKPFWFDRGKEKNKYLKSFLPGTCVLQTGWLDDGVIMCLHWLTK